MKPAELLKVDDLRANPIWQYVNDDKGGETLVKPIKRIPVKNLVGRLVGLQVRLSNGKAVWAMIANVDTENPRLTEHFLTISLERDGRWFTLSRYHDFDYASKGPLALSDFFGLDVDDVFPITYDLSRYSGGNVTALVGQIPKQPSEKLARAKIIAMAVPLAKSK